MKEQVAYFKFWQGIVVLTDISLLGWLVSAVDEADRLRIYLALLGVAVLTFGAVLLHWRINRRVQRIGEL